MNALILVDLQNDFLPGGALGVQRGDELIEIANRLMLRFDLVVATQDWHPADHLSFAAQHDEYDVGDVIDLDGLPQVLWPVHCVQGTGGAEFASGLNLAGIASVFPKGTDRRRDSYSGFYDNGGLHPTGLGRYLVTAAVDTVHVMGLATDYCVRATAIDAVRLGFVTHLIESACRGVELHPGDCEHAIDEMRQSGVQVDSLEV